MGLDRLKEELIGSDVRAALLTLFHNDPGLVDTVEGLAHRIGRERDEVRQAVEALAKLGLLKETRAYSFARERNIELVDAILKQPLEPEIVSQRAERAVSKIPIGLDVLKRVLPDGIPALGTLLILSDPGAGEERLLAHFVAQMLEDEKSIAYVAVDDFPGQCSADYPISHAKRSPRLVLAGIRRLLLEDCWH